MGDIAITPNFDNTLKVILSYLSSKYGVPPQVTSLYDSNYYANAANYPELKMNVLPPPVGKPTKVYSWYEDKKPLVYLRPAEDESGILFQYLPGSFDGLSCKFTQDYPTVINILKAFNI